VSVENDLNSPVEKTKLSRFSKAKPTGVIKSVTPENGMKNKKMENPKLLDAENSMAFTPSTIHACLCNSTSIPPMNLDSDIRETMATEKVTLALPMNLDSERKGDSRDLHHGSCDLHPRLPVTSHPRSWGWVASVLRRAHLQQTATVVDDEIDDEKKRTLFLRFFHLQSQMLRSISSI
jgi:hypothetical protein